MIPCCTVFLFTDDFTFPNKPASFVIKDADLADSLYSPSFRLKGRNNLLEEVGGTHVDKFQCHRDQPL